MGFLEGSNGVVGRSKILFRDLTWFDSRVNERDSMKSSFRFGFKNEEGIFLKIIENLMFSTTLSGHWQW